MSPIDRETLAERTMVVERHLGRVADRLPSDRRRVRAGHGRIRRGRPASVAGDAGRHRSGNGRVPAFQAGRAGQLCGRVSPSRGRRDDRSRARIAARSRGRASATSSRHAYDQLDMVRVYRAAREGPADLASIPRGAAGSIGAARLKTVGCRMNLGPSKANRLVSLRVVALTAFFSVGCAYLAGQRSTEGLHTPSSPGVRGVARRRSSSGRGSGRPLPR